MVKPIRKPLGDVLIELAPFTAILLCAGLGLGYLAYRYFA